MLQDFRKVHLGYNYLPIVNSRVSRVIDFEMGNKYENGEDN